LVHSAASAAVRPRVKDRVPLETIIAWREDLERAPTEPVRFEVELWFHENAARRTTAFERLAAEVEVAGGEIKDHAVIPGIYYDGVLVDIPAAEVRVLIDNPSVGLARTDEVMFLRPQSVGEYPSADFEGSDSPASPETPSFISVEPIAALLDGLPVENHVASCRTSACG
jgi:hypothetical protein